MITHPFRDETDVTPDLRAARLGERRRLGVLEVSGLLDGVANPVLDRIARLAAGILGVPIALVSLVDDRRQHFPGLVGLGGWAGAARGTTLSHSFCQHVVTRDAALVVSDATTDPLVMDNLAFKDLGVVAYAGVPLRTTSGETLGALCAIDGRPVQWTASQVALLEDLAAVAMAEIELRATVQTLTQTQARWAADAERDALTGLLNRRGFTVRARQRQALAQQTGAAFSIVAVSVDGFRCINAQHGHDIGDLALVDMAALLSTVVREGDAVARTGDNDFALLLTDAWPQQSLDIQARIDTALASLNAEFGREVELQASVGVAQWLPDAPLTLANMMRRADDMRADRKRERHTRTVDTAPFAAAAS